MILTQRRHVEQLNKLDDINVSTQSFSKLIFDKDVKTYSENKLTSKCNSVNTGCQHI